MLQKLGIHRWLMLLALVTTFLTGCNGNDNNTTAIAGVAAVGAAFTGTIDIVDANGATRTGIAIGANGAYTADTTGMAAPFIIRATGNGAYAGTFLYSVADALTGTFNITPMTNLALEVARRNATPPPADLATLFADWNALYDPADLDAFRAAIKEALAIVNANLSVQLTANGLTPTSYDFLRGAFPAFGQGIDAVLDGLVITFGEGITITFNGGPVTFDIEIGIGGYDIGGNGGGSNTACGAGSIDMTFAKAPQNAAPHNDGEQVCFTASTTSLAFSGKTLTNPTQNQAVQLPYSAYRFTDAATGFKYEVVFNNGAMHEINVLNGADTFVGQFSATPGAGGGGALACDTSQFIPNSVHAASAQDLSSFAGNYTGTIYNPNATQSTATFTAAGALTVGGQAKTATSVCVDNAVGSNGAVLYVHFADGHVDLFGDGTFSGSMAPMGGGGGTGTLTVSVNAGGIVGANVTYNNVPTPANQADFCGSIQNDATFTQIGTGAGGTLTMNSCSYANNVGTLNATLAVTGPVSVTVPYIVTYTYN